MNYHLIHQDSISTVLDTARQYRALRQLVFVLMCLLLIRIIKMLWWSIFWL